MFLHRIVSPAQLLAALVVALSMLITLVAHASDEPDDDFAILFHDGEFNPAHWTQQILEVWDDGLGSSSSWSHRASGGNPGAYARCVNSVVIDGNNGGGLWTAMVCQEYSWNPAEHGRLETALVSFDKRRSEQQGITQTLRIVVAQGDTKWVWGAGGSQTFSWTTTEREIDLTQPGIGYRGGKIVDAVPDLSPTGGPLYFGFAYGNSNPPGLGSHTASNDYDNFRVCVPATDTDGDGLLDVWEVHGIPYTNLAGEHARYIIDVNGDGVSDANVLKADVFVEVDVMDQIEFSPLARQLLIRAFEDAPIDNPDGSSGVRLHLVCEPTRIAGETEPQYTSSVGYDDASAMPIGFTEWREQFFGMKAERDQYTAAEWPAIAEARARAFRYGLIMSEFTIPGASFFEEAVPFGKSQGIPSDSFVVCNEPIVEELEAGDSYFDHTYEWTSDEFMATIFMHELGHAMGLGHGGFDLDGNPDHTNGKPNYFSVMNYFTAIRDSRTKDWWRLNFTTEDLGPPIVEIAYNEAEVLPIPSWITTSRVLVPVGISSCEPECDTEHYASYRALRYATAGRKVNVGRPAALDDPCAWCPESSPNFSNVVQDFEHFPPNYPNRQTPELTVLASLNDWNPDWLHLAPTIGQQFAGSDTFDARDEIGRRFLERSRQYSAELPCIADIAEPFDGTANHADLLAFVNAFQVGDMANAEWHRDGLLDLKDIVGYLTEFQRPECQE